MANHIFALVTIMLMAGVFGGLLNFYMQSQADTDSTRLEERQGERGNARQELAATLGAGWWSTEPDVGRVANGVPRRSHRLKQLGNAVVPQVVEQIGKAIWSIEYGTNQN